MWGMFFGVIFLVLSLGDNRLRANDIFPHLHYDSHAVIVGNDDCVTPITKDSQHSERRSAFHSPPAESALRGTLGFQTSAPKILPNTFSFLLARTMQNSCHGVKKNISYRRTPTQREG